MTQTQKVAIILLAAGGSRRLGKPKLSLHYHNKPLLIYMAEQALSFNLPVYVVLGANRQNFLRQLNKLPVQTCINESWEKGISTSIQCGLHALKDSVDNVLFMLCDQPFIPIQHYQKLLQLSTRHPQHIIATQYPTGRIGVPALIPKPLFSELLELKGDQGARNIIDSHSNIVISESCHEAAWDIDTHEQSLWLTHGPPTTP